MTKQENQRPQVSLETSSEEAQVEEPAATAEELPINVNSQTLSQIFEKSSKDYLKAAENLTIAIGYWTLAQLSKGK
jgi:hypothetical protein